MTNEILKKIFINQKIEITPKLRLLTLLISIGSCIILYNYESVATEKHIVSKTARAIIEISEIVLLGISIVVIISAFKQNSYKGLNFIFLFLINILRTFLFLICLAIVYFPVEIAFTFIFNNYNLIGIRYSTEMMRWLSHLYLILLTWKFIAYSRAST
jgi:hypothetical protein